MTATYHNDVKGTIRDFVRRSIAVADLDDNVNLFESGIVNSLFAVQLVTFIEKEFGIEIGTDDLDMDNFKSLDATAAFVLKKTDGRAVA